MDKVSSIIENSCCGQGLPIGCSQFKLARMVSDLEEEVVRLKNEIIQIQVTVNNTSRKLS